jgi:hypothetical protein
MTAQSNFFLFLGLVIFGVIVEILLAKLYYHIRKRGKNGHFYIGRYLFLLLFPLIASGLMIHRIGIPLLGICLIFALLGTFLEWLIGYSYHTIVGQRLWTYHRFAITTYTSFLSIPIWGMAGILFWLLANMLR